jgi:hypothetical protein
MRKDMDAVLRNIEGYIEDYERKHAEVRPLGNKERI